MVFTWLLDNSASIVTQLAETVIYFVFQLQEACLKCFLLLSKSLIVEGIITPKCSQVDNS